MGYWIEMKIQEMWNQCPTPGESTKERRNCGTPLAPVYFMNKKNIELWCPQIVLDISTKHYPKVVHQTVKMQRVMIIDQSQQEVKKSLWT